MIHKGKDIKDKNSIGYRIRQQRIKENMRQEDLANLLGVSKSVISHWELSKYKPSKENLRYLQVFFPDL